MSTNRIKVLCLTDYYLPGYKGGGLIRTISNMCDAVVSQVEFSIFTRDRDLGSDVSYPGIHVNGWNIINNTQVYYASPSSFNFSGLIKAIETRKFEVIYLNSFFSYNASIAIYLRWRFGKVSDAHLLIAPRGEFSKGAFALKFLKKKVFLMVCRLLGFYRDVYWHASTELEAADILKIFPYVGSRIHLAVDPVTIENIAFSEIEKNIENEGEFQLVFISRISSNKNLDGLLDIVARLKKRTRLSIFGPIEHQAYWRQCQSIMASLPSNVVVDYCGMLEPREVSRTFGKFDLFCFPTYGENFGHVIFESLRSGTPVLVSDQTPWQHQSDGSVTVLPLEARDAWVSAIEYAADRNADQQRKLRLATIAYAERYMSETDSLSANLKMFREIAALGSRENINI